LYQNFPTICISRIVFAYVKIVGETENWDGEGLNLKLDSLSTIWQRLSNTCFNYLLPVYGNAPIEKHLLYFVFYDVTRCKNKVGLKSKMHQNLSLEYKSLVWLSMQKKKHIASDLYFTFQLINFKKELFKNFKYIFEIISNYIFYLKYKILTKKRNKSYILYILLIFTNYIPLTLSPLTFDFFNRIIHFFDMLLYYAPLQFLFLCFDRL